MEKKRIFLAVNLPEEIKREISQEQGEIDNLFPEELNQDLIRWTKQDNVHITLLFLGNLKEEDISRLKEIAEETAEHHGRFSLKLNKIDYGPPGAMPPRMIWLEVEKSQALKELAEEIKRKTLKVGILKKNDPRPFSPHMTLARIRTWQWRRIEPEERPIIKRTVGHKFSVQSIEIMESKLKRGGAEYKILESFNLK